MGPRAKKTNMRNGQWALETNNQGERADNSTPAEPVVHNRVSRAIKANDGTALVKMARLVKEVGKLDQDMVNLLYKVLEPMADSKVKRRLKQALPDLEDLHYKREEKSLGDPKWQIVMSFKTEGEGEAFLSELVEHEITDDVKDLRQALDEILITYGAFKAGKTKKTKSEEEKKIDEAFGELGSEEDGETGEEAGEEAQKPAAVEAETVAIAEKGKPVPVTPAQKKVKMMSFEQYSKDYLHDVPDAKGSEIMAGWNQLQKCLKEM